MRTIEERKDIWTRRQQIAGALSITHVGCTQARHAHIGVHAAINARAGQTWRNSMTDEDWNVWRDADAIRRLRCERVRIPFLHWNSKMARKILPEPAIFMDGE